MLKTRKQDRANRLRRLRLESLENRRLLAADLAIDVAAKKEFRSCSKNLLRRLALAFHKLRRNDCKA